MAGSEYGWFKPWLVQAVAGSSSGPFKLIWGLVQAYVAAYLRLFGSLCRLIRAYLETCSSLIGLTQSYAGLFKLICIIQND